MLKLICHPKCSTCAKARKWLENHNVSYIERDIIQQKPREEELLAWQRTNQLPWRRFFNTSGMKYRDLGLKDRLPAMAEREIVAVLASDGMLVKRPVLLGEDFVLLGFREKEWAALLERNN